MLSWAPGRQQEAPAAGSPTTAAVSLTDWFLSAWCGAPWQYLTGQDLLPAGGGPGGYAPLEQQEQGLDPEDPQPQPEEGREEPERLYEASGSHGMAGYHVKTVGNAPVAPPRKLTDDEASAAAATADTSGGGPSAWNAGGTWESRDTSSWTRSRLPQLCASPIASIAVLGGDSSIAVVRGQQRAGFDLELELGWGEGGRCTVEVMDSDDPSDLELPPSAPDGLRTALAEALEQLKEEMLSS